MRGRADHAHLPNIQRLQVKYGAVPPFEDSELAVCRKVADRAIFIIGSGRSGTTVVAQMINSSIKALLLTEANFFIPDKSSNFHDWYEEQHRSFNNQITKSSHAPNFCRDPYHTWWQWLAAAADVYERVGDKIALSNHQLNLAPPASILSFFELRFFTASYVFTIRDPVQTLLSTARLLGLGSDEELRPQMVAWLRVVQLWADFVRTFPRVFTLISDAFSRRSARQLCDYLNLDVRGVEHLFDPRARRHYLIDERFPTLAAYRERLQEVFSTVNDASLTDPLLQAGQTRILALKELNPRLALGPGPIGLAWALAQTLIEELDGPRLN